MRPGQCVAVARNADEAIGNSTVGVELVADVEHRLLPGVVADLHTHLAHALAVGLLRLHIDDRARIAGPIQHRRRPTQHSDAVDRIRGNAPICDDRCIRRLQPVDKQRRFKASQRRIQVRAVVGSI